MRTDVVQCKRGIVYFAKREADIMKKYEKPIVMINEELAEGVYANSGLTGPMGTSDCWSFDVQSPQPWNGSHHVFEIHLTHHTGLQHISGATTVSVTFSAPLTNVYAEYTSTFDGTSTITISRELLADAYNDGDLVTYKIWAQAADQATTEGLTVTNVAVSCDKQINVQGNGGDEI